MPSKTAVAVDAATSPRGKKRSSSVFSSGDETKKTRGRPRVEPQDKTAADRRRTQIRLAQRSYRQRKEGTITDLQNKVSELEFIISEMNDTYQDLSRSALRTGQAKPDDRISRQLVEAAGRFMELTRSVKRQKMGQHSSSDESTSEPTEKSLSPPLSSIKRSPPDNSSNNPVPNEPAQSGPTIVSLDQRGIPSVWGYETLYPAPVDFPAEQNDGSSAAQEAPTLTSSQPVYETSQALVSGGFYQQPLGPPTPLNYPMYSFNPGAEITLPMSYAHMELNFGRRLSRFITEAGVRLLTMKFPPGKRVREVFGHVMKYYGQQQLRDLLVESLRLAPNQPLETRAVYPYAGPLTSQVWSIQMLDDKARSDMLCKEDNKDDGAWFLPDDVERFLQAKGITIPFGASFVNWEFSEFVPIQQLTPPWPSPAASNDGDEVPNYDGNFVPADHTPPEYSQSISALTQPISTLMDGGEMPMNPMADVPSSGTIPYAAPPPNTFYPSNFITHNVSAMAPKAQLVPQKYTLDIMKFMCDLQAATQCLGKTPGFRRRDVESAFKESLMPIGVTA